MSKHGVPTHHVEEDCFHIFCGLQPHLRGADIAACSSIPQVEQALVRNTWGG